MKVSRAEQRVFSLPCRSHVGDQWQVVADVTSEYGRHLVTLRSPIRVVNNLSLGMEVYFLQDTIWNPVGARTPTEVC